MRMGMGCQEEKTGMRIADLLAALPAEEHEGAGAGDVTSVTYESDAVRQARASSRFVGSGPMATTTSPLRWRGARRWWLVRRRRLRFPRRPDVCAARRFAPGVGHRRRHARGEASPSLD